MGIFSKKEVCPVCGRAMRGDVRIKIKDNVEVCSNCSAQIEMDATLLPTMTAEDIKAHLKYREENRRMMEEFTKTQSAEAGSYRLRVDEERRLWYFTNNRKDSNPPLYSFSALKTAVYLENGEPAEDLQTGLKGLLEKQTPVLVSSMLIRIEVENPYIHEMVAETLKTGEGVTAGTMQYKMKRRAIREMMDLFALIQSGEAAGAEEVSGGEAEPGWPEEEDLSLQKEE